MTKPITCLNCSAKFYPSSPDRTPSCATCSKTFCPNCGGCECTVPATKQQLSFRQVMVQEVNAGDTGEGYNLEVSGTLSPLVRQRPVKTREGMKLLSEFEFEDETGKIPLMFWGPVPTALFPHRYEFVDVTIRGVRVRQFNDKKQLVAQRNSRIALSQLRTKPLAFFLGQTA